MRYYRMSFECQISRLYEGIAGLSCFNDGNLDAINYNCCAAVLMVPKEEIVSCDQAESKTLF
jgi:hypothetical protein